MMDLFYHRKFPVYTVHVYIYIELSYNRNIYISYNVHGFDIFIVGLTMKSSIQKQKHHNESSSREIVDSVLVDIPRVQSLLR